MGASYHYIRIFNSWVEAYKYPAAFNNTIQDPVLTGVPFNDVYRYMDWLLTVPLLLVEIVFVMKLSPEETATKATHLGVASALMIIFGYPGELVLDEEHIGTRWDTGPPPWFLSASLCTPSSLACPTPPTPRPMMPSSPRSAPPSGWLSSPGAPTPSSTSSPCSVPRAPPPLSASRWATASATSSPSAVLASSSTASPTPRARPSRPASSTKRACV